MAYIKIFPIKVTVKKAISYITNPDKTDDQLLVSSFGCSPETADLEFAMTAEMGKNNVMDKGNNLAWHMVISFHPNELSDPNLAHEVGTKIADSVLKGKYEYVLTTHTDKDHVHCHLIFNATSFTDYHKYISNKRPYHKICRVSNRICKDYNLSPSMPTSETGRSYKENLAYKAGRSWKAKMKYQIDRAIWTSVTYDEFLIKMKEAGYEIRQGKYLAFRAPGAINFINVKTLGTYYADDHLLVRLEKNRCQARTPIKKEQSVRLFAKMTACISEHDKAGYEHWVKLNNLKEAARTYNYLSERNLLNYEDFKNHVADITAAVQATETKIQNLQAALDTQRLLQKRCDVYRHCRNIVLAEEKALNKNAYRKKHQAEYQLHDATLQELSEFGIKKLPSQEKLQKQIQKLENELASVQKERIQLQADQRTLRIVQSNFSSMLQDTDILPELFSDETEQSI